MVSMTTSHLENGLIFKQTQRGVIIASDLSDAVP